MGEEDQYSPKTDSVRAKPYRRKVDFGYPEDVKGEGVSSQEETYDIVQDFDFEESDVIWD